jgi:hypothetical protein
MKELKPFHESVIDSLKLCVEDFHGYLRPSGEFSSQPVLLLIKDLHLIVHLIESTKIPQEKTSIFLSLVKDFFNSIIQEVESSDYEKEDIKSLKDLSDSVCNNLKLRL